MTFNLAHGRGIALTQSAVRRRSFFERHLDDIAELLASLDATAVALQEAELGSRWAADFDHVAYLAQAAGYPHLHATPHVHDDVHRYGTALLSRTPLRDRGGHTFEHSGRWAKGFTHARLALPDRDVRVVSVHLDFASAKTRSLQVRELVDFLPENEAVVVAGDFNAPWRDRRATAVRLAAEAGGLTPGAIDVPMTHPSTGRTIDWILHGPTLRTDRYEVLSGQRLSDHRPVVAELCWRR